jgi:hypothetical protein
MPPAKSPTVRLSSSTAQQASWNCRPLGPRAASPVGIGKPRSSPTIRIRSSHGWIPPGINNPAPARVLVPLRAPVPA